MTVIYTITISITITITITLAITITMIMMMTMTIDLPDGAEGGIGGYIYLGMLQLDQMKGKVTSEYIGREIKTAM